MPTSCSSCSVSAGSGAEAVDQLGGERLDVVRRFERGEAAVHLQAQVEVLDVTLWNQGGGVDRDLRRPVLRLLGYASPPSLRASMHGFLEQVVVQLEADLPDVAGLLVAEQIAGAADVQVVRGELEAGAELVQALDDVQPALGGLAQLLLGRQGEVGVAAHLAAADAAAQLVQLRQAEAVGAVHDQGVGGRHVEPGFDDVGGHQQVDPGGRRTPS